MRSRRSRKREWRSSDFQRVANIVGGKGGGGSAARLIDLRFSSMGPSQFILYLLLLLALLFRKCAKTGDFSTLEIMSQ